MNTTPTLLGVCMTLFLFCLTTAGQVSINTTGPAGAYTQDFNTAFLGTTTYSLTDNAVANPGWYALRSAGNVSPNVLAADTGSSTTGQLKNYGSSGNADRALGSLATSGTGAVFYGIRIQNDTGVPIQSVRVQYTGEQWRAASADADTLAFSYQISDGDIISLTAGTWTNFTDLNFVSPNNTSTGAVDGNALANRIGLDRTLLVDIPAGSEIMLRWNDVDDTGFDHGLAIDDVVVTFLLPSAAPVTISGRALNAAGYGIGRVSIQLSGGSLAEPRRAITSPFGYYRFDDVPAGFTYLVEASGKNRVFKSRTVNADDNITDCDFIELSP
jgi:hypothetical protein